MSPTDFAHREPNGGFDRPWSPVGERTLRWPSVGIESVEVLLVHDGPRRGWYRIAAIVRLGELTPADVVVALVPALWDPETYAELGEHDRLWSALPFDNGAYLFETDVPPERLHSDERLKVHVGPRDHVLTSFARGTPSGCWHLLPPPSGHGAS